MSLDVLDAAFVRRLAVRPPQAGSTRTAPPAVAEPRPRERPAPRPVFPDAVVPDPAAGDRPVGDAAVADPVVGRLLERAPEEWDALVGHVEAARARGRRVVAVAGGRAGEGRSTVVRCLAARLRSRGRDVACAAPHDLPTVATGADGRAPTHDKRIVLVDAGVWFPPGPIRRSVLQVASLGCDAAILVRRAGAAGGFARQAALEALGIEVLGEVLTFTSPAGAADLATGGARP